MLLGWSVHARGVRAEVEVEVRPVVLIPRVPANAAGMYGCAALFAATLAMLHPSPFGLHGALCNRAVTPLMTAPAEADQVALVELSLPLGPPHLYEQALQDALGDRGEILRWYVARVVDATVVIECVMLKGDD